MTDAIFDGLSALFRNILPLSAAITLGLITYVLSVCTCIGAIVFIPLLTYGAIVFVLQMVDGKASVRALWSGVENAFNVFLSMWGMLLVFFGILLPPILLGLMATFALALDPIAAGIVSGLTGALYSLFSVRFLFAPFLLAEGRTGILDAFGESYRRTGAVWGKMIAIQLILVVLSSPTQVISVGVQILSKDSPISATPEQLLAQMQPLMGLYLAMTAISVITGSITWSIVAAAYRQVFGHKTLGQV